jgi:rhomboid protease GluP
MAVGFTPKYTEKFSFEELTKGQSLMLAFEAAQNLEWNVSHVSAEGLIAYTNNGIFFNNYKITLRLHEHFAELTSESIGNEMIDFGKNKQTLTKYLTALRSFKKKADSQALQNEYERVAADLIPAEDDILLKPKATTKESFVEFLTLFKPAEGYVITPVLINFNVLIFVLMALNGVGIVEPNSEGLLAWGANFKPMTLDGQWWRLVTNCFIHIGVFHLLMNMYALLFIGAQLEPLIGKTRFTAAYIITGIGASLTSLWWHDFTISAGASGAIFGLYGVFLAMLTTNFIEPNARKALVSSIGLFIGYNLLNGLRGGIDNAAHIGGLLSGLAVGYAFYPSLTQTGRPKLKLLIVGGLSSMTLLVTAIVYTLLPNDIAAYDAGMQSFTSQESMALEVGLLNEGAPKEDILYGIKERGIYYWQENIRLVQRLDSLTLPEEVHQRNRKLEEYCQLRIKSYSLMYKAVQEDNEIYKDSVYIYNEQIESLVSTIK